MGIRFGLPDEVSPEDVQDSLESMSDQLMVDLNFDMDLYARVGS